MLFNSPEFLLLFLPFALAGYYMLRHRRFETAAVRFLVVCSLFFYGWWEPIYLTLIVGSILFNYVVGRALLRRPTKAVLTFGVVMNLGLLGVFKYANLAIGSVASLTGGALGAVDIILPLAISFFTFQQVAYLVDAYQGKVEEPGFTTYCLFVSFFPQLIAGPIVHHREMIPQFLQRHEIDVVWRNLAIGFTIATIGLFKKLVLADRAGFWGDQSFGAVARGIDVSFIEAWVGVLGFSFQIYFDFSGYTDMAIGLARMFGIILPLNFASPYKATSIIDFWRGWHMTLTRFLRDYLYFPLGGNRLGPARRYVNLMIVMLLGGLWHGASWTFVAWGGLHGVYLAVNHGWRAWRGGSGDPSPAGRWAGRIVTFLAVTVAWTFFRAESFADAVAMLRGLVGLNGVTLPAHYAGPMGGLAPWLADLGLVFGAVPAYSGGWQIVSLAALLGFVWFFPNTQEILRDYEPSLDDARVTARTGRLVWRPSLAAGIGIGGVASYLALSLFRGSSGEFIYFQF
jgi:alginate O-acetyltransferase complex protein AlgI